jgi:hypothetical protein
MIRKVISLSFFALALLIVSRGEASAQGIGAATLPSQCTTTVNVTNVQYAGKDNGKDKILVTWSAARPQSACVDIKEFRVDVKVVRKHGHEDSASKTFGGAERSGVIEVPRAALETDPESFDVSVNAKVNGEKDKTIKVTGSGSPSIGSASQVPTGSSGPCDPTIKVTTLNFFPAETPGKDVLGVFWDASLSDACLTFSNFRVTVKVTRVDGGIQTANSGLLTSPTRSARIELPKSVGVASFEVTVETRLVGNTTNVLFSARKQGNF